MREASCGVACCGTVYRGVAPRVGKFHKLQDSVALCALYAKIGYACALWLLMER